MNNKKQMRRIWSFILSFVLCLSLLSISVWAAADDETEAETTEVITEDDVEDGEEEAIESINDVISFEEEYDIEMLCDEDIDETSSVEPPTTTEADLSSTETSEVEQENYDYASWINPAYADLFDIGILQLKTQDIKGQQPLATREVSYTTIEDAAAFLREQLKQRNESVTISFTFPGDYDSTVWGAIFQNAYAHTGVPDEGDYIFYQLGGWGRRTSISGNTGTSTFSITYYTDAEQEQEMNTAVTAAMSTLSLDGKSDYEKIKIIHDYIIAHVTYDYEHLGTDYDLMYTPYAALINGTSVCQGYAVLTYRLMLLAGIDCRVITGDADNGSIGKHAWNIVKLNGKYYYLDTTWDDGTNSYYYFLKCDFEDHWVDENEFDAAFFNMYPIASSDFVPGEDVYTITVSSSEHGSVTVDKTSAAVGERVTITVTAEEDSDLDTLDVTGADGEQIDIHFTSDGTYFFYMPVGNVTISATFVAYLLPQFMMHTIELDGQIGVNFYMDLPEIEGVDWNASYMDFYVNGQRSNDVFDAEFKDGKGKYYGFTCYLNSVQMAETITAEFHYDDEVVVEFYALQDYLEEFDENKSDLDAELAAVVEAIADYGHYIQPMLAEEDGWKVGEKYAEMTHYYTTEGYNISAVKEAVSGYGVDCIIQCTEIEKLNYRAVFDSETSIEVMIELEEGYEGNITAAVDGKEAAAELQADGRYKVEITNIPGYELGKTYKVEVMTAGGKATVKVSGMSYVKDMLEAYAEKPIYQNAAASLYYYYHAASEYKN